MNIITVYLPAIIEWKILCLRHQPHATEYWKITVNHINHYKIWGTGNNDLYQYSTPQLLQFLKFHDEHP